MSDAPIKITPVHFLPKFCSQCGSALKEKYVAEENHDRLICEKCGYIVYLNPKIVAGVIPEKNGKILLLRRGIEPQKSFWTFPAGFVELWETVPSAAVRETKEEIGVDILPGRLLGIYSYSDAGVVTVVYLADVVGGTIQTSGEAEEVAEFKVETIPWEELAFKSTREALEDWVKLIRK